MSVGRAPRLAILGPPGCGKTQVLTRLRDAVMANAQPMTRTLTVDLHNVPIGSLNHMYQVINRVLMREAADSGVLVDFDVSNQYHHLRFPQILMGLMENVEGYLILFIDHLDSVPRYFARDLSHRLRDLLEKTNQKFDSMRLGIIVAGTISLIELRQEVNSPILMYDLTLLPVTDPAVRRHMVEERLRSFDIQDAPAEIVDLLAHETGGELGFLDLLLNSLPTPGEKKKPALTPITIQAAIDDIIFNGNVDPLRHLAFHLWGDKDLRDIVRDLNGGHVVMRRAVTSDTDRFHLNGAVIAARSYPTSYESYRFRNGIVERFLKRLLDLLEGDSAEASGIAVLKEVRMLEEIKGKCGAAQNIWSSVENLLPAWKILTPYGHGQPLINLYITDQSSDSGWWLDLNAKSVSRMELQEEPTEAARRAAFYAVRSIPLAVGSTAEGINVSFGHDNQHISLGIPLNWRRTRVVLLTTLHRAIAGNEYTEFTLNRWIRFVHELRQAIAILALAQLGQSVVLEEFKRKGEAKSGRGSVTGTEAADKSLVKQVFWLPNYGAIISETGSVTTLPGTVRSGAINDINSRCLELVKHTTNSRQYHEMLKLISDQFVEGLKAIPNLCEQIASNAPAEQLVITTGIEGLELPFEILPLRKSYISLLKPIARQISEIQMEPGQRRSFRQMLSSLIKEAGTLHVLLVASDAGGKLPKAGQELEAIKKSIKTGCDRISLEVKFTEIDTTRASIVSVERELLGDRPYHLFHFVGHAFHFLKDQSESGIVLMGENGQPEIVSCQRLRHWVEESDLSLVYLSSCYSSAVSGSAGTVAQPYTGAIEAFVAGGVPNVLGFRWAVSDAGAFNFASEFYRHLFEVQGREKDLLTATHHARRSTELRPDSFDVWASSILVTQVW